MEQILNKLSEIELTAQHIMEDCNQTKQQLSAEAEKNCQDYDQQLEAQTTAQIRQIRQKLEEEKDTRLSALRTETEATFSALDTYYDDLGTTLGEALLAPTRIYVKALKSIKNAGVTVKACSHITGGGFYENVPRMLIDGVKAVVKKDSYPIPPIFTKLAKEGNVDEHAMYNTYNMGIGMIVAVDPADVDKTMEAIKAAGETPYVVGRIEAGEKGVTLC